MSIGSGATVYRKNDSRIPDMVGAGRRHAFAPDAMLHDLLANNKVDQFLQDR